MPEIRRILHLAPFNTSGVPITFVHAERKLGLTSRLITLARDPRGYEEDVCLTLPLLSSNGVRWAKRAFSNPQKLTIKNHPQPTAQAAPVWQPHSAMEKWLIAAREALWQHKIRQVMRDIDFWNFDLYQFDGGMEFFRDGRTVRELKRRGKKIIVLYTGSDLRTRGLLPEVHRLADLRLTLEFDHLALDPGLTHIFFPFAFDNFAPAPKRPPSGNLVIGHAPTNRDAKGSATILAAIDNLRRDFAIQLELIEGVTHELALRRKAQCDIFVDNLSALGYGVNAIEALALGVCTCTSVMPEFVAQYPDHPFVAITTANVQEQLRGMCASAPLRHELAQKGRAWAEQHHDARQVVRRVHQLLEQHTHTVHQ